MTNSNQNFAFPPITSSNVISPVDTTKLFKTDYSEPRLSPIDQYFENNKSLNLISLSPSFNQDLASIVLLGYMSAVESYLRAILRGVIIIDAYSQILVENMDIPYAAAIYHDGHLLPEALLEGISLANPNNIKDSLKSFIGLKGKWPTDVEMVLGEFSKICELRHCCVHRFGKLGTKNAVRLGLSNHYKLLEKPLYLSQSNLEDISFVLRSLVNTLNRFMYENLLDRMAKNRGDQGQKLYLESWTWNYVKDKKRFLKYYKLFSSTEDSAPSPPSKKIYDAYRKKYKGIG